MIPRQAERRLRALASMFPVVTVTGPRQSGKTTLCRMAFPDKRYVSLEAPDLRQYAVSDPRGFLREVQGGAIIDEIQRAPELTSYLQGEVDHDPTAGRFVLTGSRNFQVLEALSQSLAGRSGLLELLPLELSEIQQFEAFPSDRFHQLVVGSYPAIYDRSLHPKDWFDAYSTAYVERDVRQVLQVGNLLAFRTFLELVAGRVGQLLNLSQLGADVGITHNTARSWLSVLEAGYLVFRLPPFHANLRKRLVRSPKVYFYDTGLICHLLGIRTGEQLGSHPLRGPIFENWVVAEWVKLLANRGHSRRSYFYRDRQGLEVDLLCPEGNAILAMEIKSAETISTSFLDNLDKLDRLLESDQRPLRRHLVYGGDTALTLRDTRILPWNQMRELVPEATRS